jgi:Acetyltransferase (GNAT) family
LAWLAGGRRSNTLERGEHPFVDDLVTLSEERHRGRGAEMIRRLAEQAREESLARICLDSRATAKAFDDLDSVLARLGALFRLSFP